MAAMALMLVPAGQAGAQELEDASSEQDPSSFGTVAVTPLVTIYPGDSIDPSMVAERTFAQLRPVRGGYVSSASALVDKVARRTLMPGIAIPSTRLRTPSWCRRACPRNWCSKTGVEHHHAGFTVAGR